MAFWPWTRWSPALESLNIAGLLKIDGQFVGLHWGIASDFVLDR
jgi:hypothetical protein